MKSIKWSQSLAKNARTCQRKVFEGILRESSPGKEINLWDEEDEAAPQVSFSHTRSMTTRVGVAVR